MFGKLFPYRWAVQMADGGNHLTARFYLHRSAQRFADELAARHGHAVSPTRI